MNHGRTNQPFHWLHKKIHLLKSRTLTSIFEDEQRIVKVCDLMVQIIQLKPPMVQSRIQASFDHQKQRHLQSTSHLRKRSSKAFKSCKENEDRQENLKFVWWIFDSGGHLWNLGASFLQAGENYCSPDS